MYKLLLSWRYLRTRYIALASIISVTLGVATLIVVNSVMAGFSKEMHTRLHGILSDIVLESHSIDGFADPQWHMEQIRKICGDDIAGMTPVIHVPALMRIAFRGDYHNRQINLIGVDKTTYAEVSDFSQYLLHPENKRQLSFLLREDGYAPGRKDFPVSGWTRRREQAVYQKSYEEELRRIAPARTSMHRQLPATRRPPILTLRAFRKIRTAAAVKRKRRERSSIRRRNRIRASFSALRPAAFEAETRMAKYVTTIYVGPVTTCRSISRTRAVRRSR